MEFILIITLMDFSEDTIAIESVPGFRSEISCLGAANKYKASVAKKNRWEVLAATCVSKGA